MSDGRSDDDPEAFVSEILEEARALRLPQLFSARNDVLYETTRNGVAVVAVRTATLSDEELDGLLLYRLAHYLKVGFVNVPLVVERRWRREPMTGVTSEDVHIVAGDAETGEVLCYAALQAVNDAGTGATMKGTDRPLLRVEHEHGRGVFNRLSRLSDVPIRRVLESGRFVKNQFAPTFDPRALRAPVEVCAAIFRVLIGPLHSDVDAVVGDFEEDVAGRSLAYFHIPLVTIDGTLPYLSQEDYLFPRYDKSSTYPFAFWVSDLFPVVDRLRTIESALRLPGDEGLLVLLALKYDRSGLASSLAPGPGSAKLNAVRLPQRELTMDERRAVRQTAAFLLGTELLKDLSVAEATALSTFFERRTVPAGQVIVRQGESGDDLYIVEQGEVEVLVETGAAPPRRVNLLRAGDYFGEVAIVNGGRRIATVTATEPTTILRLDGSSYAQYLSHTSAVQDHMTATASARTREPSRQDPERREPDDVEAGEERPNQFGACGPPRTT
jgi:hypothetical protein